MIFKLYYKNQTHLYNKSLNLSNLIQFSRRVFNDIPKEFSFIYQSFNGQMTYIETDADLIGLKYCCSAANDFMVKLTILGSMKTEIKLDDIEKTNLIKQNMDQMYERVLSEIESQASTEAISEYLKDTYGKVANQLVNEQRIVNQQVSNYLQTLYETTLLKEKQHKKSRFYYEHMEKLAQKNIKNIVQKPTQKKIVRYSPQKPVICKSQKTIDELLSEKVLQIVPSLVDKIFAKMQSKLKNKCINCLKRQIDLQKAIDNQIRKRISVCDLENPEQ